MYNLYYILIFGFFCIFYYYTIFSIVIFFFYLYISCTCCTLLFSPLIIFFSIYKNISQGFLMQVYKNPYYIFFVSLFKRWNFSFCLFIFIYYTVSFLLIIFNFLFLMFSFLFVCFKNICIFFVSLFIRFNSYFFCFICFFILFYFDIFDNNINLAYFTWGSFDNIKENEEEKLKNFRIEIADIAKSNFKYDWGRSVLVSNFYNSFTPINGFTPLNYSFMGLSDNKVPYSFFNENIVLINNLCDIFSHHPEFYNSIRFFLQDSTYFNNKNIYNWQDGMNINDILCSVNNIRHLVNSNSFLYSYKFPLVYPNNRLGYMSSYSDFCIKRDLDINCIDGANINDPYLSFYYSGVPNMNFANLGNMDYTISFYEKGCHYSKGDILCPLKFVKDSNDSFFFFNRCSMIFDHKFLWDNNINFVKGFKNLRENKDLIHFNLLLDQYLKNPNLFKLEDKSLELKYKPDSCGIFFNYLPHHPFIYQLFYNMYFNKLYCLLLYLSNLDNKIDILCLYEYHEEQIKNVLVNKSKNVQVLNYFEGSLPSKFVCPSFSLDPNFNICPTMDLNRHVLGLDFLKAIMDYDLNFFHLDKSKADSLLHLDQLYMVLYHIFATISKIKNLSYILSS